MDDEYELLSHDEIEKLKKEAERYKKNPFIKHSGDEKLYSSITSLTKALNRMASVFEEVKQKILLEQEQGDGPDAKLDSLMNQNKDIAEALLAINDKVENLADSKEMPDLTNKPSSSFNDNYESKSEDKVSNNVDSMSNDLLNNNFDDDNSSSDFSSSSKNEFSSNSDFNSDDSFKSSMSNTSNTSNASNNSNASMSNTSNASMSNLSNESNSSNSSNQDMDYTSWNYGSPTKPGVSRSNQSQGISGSDSFSQSSFGNQNQGVNQNNNFNNNQNTVGSNQFNQNNNPNNLNQNSQGFDNSQNQFNSSQNSNQNMSNQNPNQNMFNQNPNQNLNQNQQNSQQNPFSNQGFDIERNNPVPEPEDFKPGESDFNLTRNEMPKSKKRKFSLF